MPRPARKSERVAPTVFAEPDLAWRGELVRADDGSISGHLVDSYGWKLSLSAKLITPTRMDLVLALVNFGQVVAVWEDCNCRCSFEDLPTHSWLGHLTKNQDRWNGYIESSDGWIMHLAALPSAKGKLVLAGSVRDAPKRHVP